MRKMKRWAALLCAVLMAVTLLPMQVWAVETEDVSTVQEEALVNETPAGDEQAEDEPVTGNADDPGTLCRAYPDGLNNRIHVEQLSEAEAAELSILPWEELSSPMLARSNAEVDPYFNIITVERYGRSKLKKMAKSDVYLDIYDALLLLASTNFQGMLEMPKGTTIYCTDAELAVSAFYADYPELFWARPNYYYYTAKPKLCAGIAFEYNSHYDNLDEELPLFMETADNILAGMPNGSDYEKELYLHDVLVNRVTYTSSKLEEQNGYTALVEGKGVCAGYAFALQYLLMRAGIQSYYVVGYAGESHAWNLVKIDGKWYYVDATWDDPVYNGSDDPYSPYHSYFNITTAMLQEDHTPSDIPYNVPLENCTATDAFYYRVNDTIVSVTDSGLVDKVADLLQRNGGIARLYVTDSNPVKAAREWYYENIVSIARAMQVDGGYEYGYSYSGREIILFFSGSYLSKTPGDLNGDSNITILDVDLLYQYLTTGRPTITSVMTEAQFLDNADVNRDTIIDVYDLQLLYETVCNG